MISRLLLLTFISLSAVHAKNINIDVNSLNTKANMRNQVKNSLWNQGIRPPKKTQVSADKRQINKLLPIELKLALSKIE